SRRKECNMPATGCAEAMQLLNVIFTTPLILNDGHEILVRLNAGDDVVDIVSGLNEKFGDPRLDPEIRAVGERWPKLQLEAVNRLVSWALSKLDTDDRITISWKGDAEYHETVTRFEVKEHQLHIEFLHPPVTDSAAPSRRPAAGFAS
ncbi:MAG: hypothetical protein HY852_17485, partial [Bradyrhizobium sp.]|uniref:hypothetical protein n=1 Tax=Bradyrhizobium sp. TaxID=376 RepID=UPI0025C1CCDC